MSTSLTVVKDILPKVVAVGGLAALLLYNLSRSRLAKLFQRKVQPTLNLKSRDKRIIRLALTGGPCGGKTSAMNMLYDSLTDRGITTYIVPEAATLIADSGGMINTSTYSTEERIRFQYALLEAQVLLESCFESIAVYQKKNDVMVILCDRGLMDGKAYMAPQEWKQMLNIFKIDQEELSNSRYDAVFHLVTAADGAKEHYTTTNNQARMETAEEALSLDANTRKAWDIQKNLHVLDNHNKGFKEKLNELDKLVTKLVEEKRKSLHAK